MTRILSGVQLGFLQYLPFEMSLFTKKKRLIIGKLKMSLFFEARFSQMLSRSTIILVLLHVDLNSTFELREKSAHVVHVEEKQ